jgi:hypothetical protein
MDDSVRIDTDNHGEVFYEVLADIPEKKKIWWQENISLATKGETTVAVKITDILGDDV